MIFQRCIYSSACNRTLQVPPALASLLSPAIGLLQVSHFHFDFATTMTSEQDMNFEKFDNKSKFSSKDHVSGHNYLPLAYNACFKVAGGTTAVGTGGVGVGGGAAGSVGSAGVGAAGWLLRPKKISDQLGHLQPTWGSRTLHKVAWGECWTLATVLPSRAPAVTQLN